MSYSAEVLADTPIAYWRLGEPTGSPADSSGNGYTLTPNGTPTYGVTGALVGDTNKAVLLATTDWFSRPGDDDALDPHTGPMTWECWIKTTQTTAGTVYRKSDSGGGGCIIDINSTAHEVRCRVIGSGGAPTVTATTTGAVIDNGAGHHVVCVLDRAGATLKVYVDNVERASVSAASLAGNDIDAAAAALWPGHTGSPIALTLDEAAIYQTALSPARVAAHFIAGTVLPTVPRFAAKAVHELKISWDKAVGLTGWFTLGTSLLGGPDLLAPASQIVPSFSGPYDDVSAYLVEAGWSRGGSVTLQQVEQGKWRGTIRDPDGRFNPQNPASPLYGYADQPARPIRHRSRFNGVWNGEFYGWTRTIEYEPRGRRGYLHIEADDIFVRLDIPAPTIGSLTGTTTGAVIGVLLDSVGFTDPAYRDLDIGDAIAFWPGISDAASTLLALIADLLQIEFGLFYSNGNGTSTYESRNQRMLRPVDWAVSEEMRVLAPGASLDDIINRATFTVEGSTPQTYTDTTSADPVFGFGPRAAPEVRSAFLADDDAAMARAQWVVNLKKDPVGEIWALTLDNRTDDLLQAVVAMEISDRVQADEASTGSVFDGFVERLERSVTTKPYRDTISVLLSQRSTKELFLVGSSLLGGPDVLAL